MDVETGPKIQKQRSWETLRQDVGELARRGYMEHAYLAHGHTMANKVKVDLNGFGTLMLDGVRRHVDGANIVTEHNRGGRRWSMKLVKELVGPTSLGDGVSHNAVLSLGARARYHVLTLRRP
jgi:hypothetical protein